MTDSQKKSLTRLEALMMYLMQGHQFEAHGHTYSYAHSGFRKDSGIDVSDAALVSLALSFEFDPIYHEMTTVETEITEN